MLETVRETQVLFLACALLAACLAKLTIRAPEGALSAAHWRRSSGLLVAVIEGLLGVALLLTAHEAGRLATIVVFGSATWALVELRRRRPEAGCGCFGGLSTTPVGGRTLLRVTLFTLAAVAAFGVPATGAEVILRLAGWHGVIALAEFAVFAALSPEIGVMISKLRQREPCEFRTYPLADTYVALHASRSWREHAPKISGEPVDVWRELCWRFLVFAGQSDGRPIEVVFAVKLEGRRPPVHAAVVETDATKNKEGDDWDTGPREIHAAPV